MYFDKNKTRGLTNIYADNKNLNYGHWKLVDDNGQPKIRSTVS
jgi:hypothetical protein